MVATPRTLLVLTFAAALVVFSIVQDRVTAAGARQYVRLHREAALAGRANPVTVHQVMGPAIDRSVRQGLRWGGLVLVIGFVLTAAVRTRSVSPPQRRGGEA